MVGLFSIDTGRFMLAFENVALKILNSLKGYYIHGEDDYAIQNELNLTFWLFPTVPLLHLLLAM